MKLLSALNKKFEFELYIDNDLKYNDFQVGVIREFVRMVIKELGITEYFDLVLTTDREKYGIKTTAYYMRKKKLVVIYAKGRMIGDVMRSTAHELVHHLQYFEDRVPDNPQDVGGEIEDEANALAGMLVKLFIKEHPYGKYLFNN